MNKVDPSEIKASLKNLLGLLNSKKFAASTNSEIASLLPIADSLLLRDDMGKADLYILLTQHAKETKALLNLGYYEKYLASAYYGLHLLSKHHMKYEVPRLYASFQYQVINYYVHNFVADDIDELWSVVLEVIPLLEQYQHYDMIEQIRLNLLQSLDRKTVSDSLARFNLPLTKTRVNEVGNSLKKGIIFESRGKLDSARTHYNYVVSRSNELQCTIELYLAYLYIIDTYVTEQRWEQVSTMLAELPPMSECDLAFQEEVLFDLHYRNHQLSQHNADYTMALRSLASRRDLAARVHKGQSAQHLSDLYVDNAADQLRIYETILDKEGRLSDTDWWHIAHLIADSKARSTQLMRAAQQAQQPSGQQRLLDSLWHMTTHRPYEHSVYAELYAAYGQQEVASLTSSVTAHKRPPPIASGLVDFLAYDDDTFILTMSSGGNTLTSTETAELRRLTLQLRQQLYRREDITGTLAQLEQYIFGSQPRLDSIVTLVPDGPVSLAPLHTLPSLQSRNCPLRYNARDIVYDSTYSLSASEFTVLSYSDASTVSSIGPATLPELGEAYKEAKAINKLLPKSAAFFGLSLTKDRLEEALTHDAIHIATHAFVDSTDSYGVGLYVRDAEGAQLYYGYQLPAAGLPSFVYLNACETADGHYDIGEGHRSLSRYFLQGGTQTVVKTLWQVDDRSSAVFSTAFYKAWLSGLTVYDAMTKARKQVQNEYPHPYYWAGYVLEGNPNLLLTTL